MKTDKFEIRRKSFHILGGLSLILLILYDILDTFRILSLVLLAIIVILFYRHKRIKGLGWFIDNFERQQHIVSFPGKGLLFFLIGAAIATFLFEKDIAIAGLLILTLGDGVSPLVGIHYGKTKHPFSNVKFIEGTFAGILAAEIAIMIFHLLGLIDINLIYTFIAAAIAMFMEGIEVKFDIDITDDNIMIPFVSCGIIWLLPFIF